jgi:hypothetical protein
VSRRRRFWRRVRRLQLVLATPRLLERRYGLRASLSLYLVGFHAKLRRGTTFRHLKVGGRLVSAYGRDFRRLSCWAGTFTTVDGKRVSAHGLVVTVAFVSTPDGRHLPFAPEKARRHDERATARSREERARA